METNKKALAATLAAAALGAAALVTVAGGANAATLTDTSSSVSTVQDAPEANDTPDVVGTDVAEAPGVEVDDSTEAAAETNDGADVGPDMNATEPGHQDADDASESDTDLETND